MTEPNIFQEVQEDLERQRLEALWKEYGFWIMAMAVVIVLGTAGVTTYRSKHEEHNQHLTRGLLEATKTDPDAAKMLGQIDKFAAANADTNQAAFAMLKAGALAAEQNDKEKAAHYFDAAANDAHADPAFRQLGDFLSVQVQMDAGDPASLSARLQPLTADHAPWRYAAREAQGYLALRAGDKDKARQIFTSLSQDAEAPQTLAARAGDVAASID